MGGQNYFAALVFGTTYLGFVFYLKIKPTRGVFATIIGTAILMFLRSRTAILAIFPLFIKIINNFGKIQKIVILVTLCVAFLYYNPLMYILNKYGDSSLLAGFMNTRGDLWLRSFDYALANLFSPLEYVYMDRPKRYSVIGGSSAHNWILENTLMFGLFGIIPIFLTILALIRNFYYFLPLFLFAMFEPTIFYLSNIISFLFLNFLINDK